jgi:hypothetical protein
MTERIKEIRESKHKIKEVNLNVNWLGWHMVEGRVSQINSWQQIVIAALQSFDASYRSNIETSTQSFFFETSPKETYHYL